MTKPTRTAAELAGCGERRIGKRHAESEIDLEVFSMDAVANELRLAAYAADDAFHAELVRVYGRKNAGDMRYRPNDFEDEALIAAHKAKLAADEAWHASTVAA